MTYNTLESSAARAQPLELYDITVGSTSYHFVSSSDGMTVGGTAYDPLPISRDPISIGAEDRANLITFTMPASHPFALGYTTRVPGQRANLTIRRFHRTDTDSQLITIFKGVVRSVSFTDKSGIAQVGVMPISGALSRAIPRYTYQSLCNNVLFDTWCTIAETDFKYTGVVENVVNSVKFDVHNLSTKGTGWAIGGFAIYDGDYRLIIAQTSSQVRILLPFNEDITIGTMDVYAGCDHTLNICKSKFNNAINYGGFPFVPTKNPFSTGIK